MTGWTYAPLGEQAVIVSFGGNPDAGMPGRIAALSKSLAAAAFPGYIESVPSYSTLCVYFDMMRLRRPDHRLSPFETVCRWMDDYVIASLAEANPAPGKFVTVPVCYCSACAPDLADLARMCGRSVAETARCHADAQYTVAAVGFMPGFPYMSGLPEPLWCPRLDTPRTSVPAGSVAVAGRQTGIYPADSPGGWRLIGRTPLRLFDPFRQPPIALEVGDAVRFEPIGHGQLGPVLREKEVREPHDDMGA